MEMKRQEAAEKKMRWEGEAEERAHRIEMESEQSARETAQAQAFARVQETLMKLYTKMLEKGENEKADF